jgi:phage tail protein X
MRVALTKHDEPVEALATRVYGLDKPSAAELKTATSALTEANPFLRKAAEVPPGTLVTVPDEKLAASPEETHRAEPLVAGLAAEQLRGAIAHVGRQLTEDVDAEVKDAHATAKLARSSELKTLSADVAGLKEQLPHLATAAEARADDAHALRAYQKEAFAQIATDLDELLGVLGG